MAFLATLLRYRYCAVEHPAGTATISAAGLAFSGVHEPATESDLLGDPDKRTQARLPGADYPYSYSMYLMGGILAWSLFDGIVRETMDVFIRGKAIIHNSSIPLSVFLLVTVAKNIALNVILMLIMLGFGLALGVWQGLSFWHCHCSWGPRGLLNSRLLLGLFNVFYRDVSSAVRAGLPLMFWVTPIVYPLSIVDERVQGLFAVNPMTHFTSAYQAALAFGTLPDIWPLLILLIAALLLLVLNLLLYRRLRSDLVDLLWRVLTAAHVSKVYQRFQTELHRMAHRLGGVSAPVETFHALSDVSFGLALGMHRADRAQRRGKEHAAENLRRGAGPVVRHRRAPRADGGRPNWAWA